MPTKKKNLLSKTWRIINPNSLIKNIKSHYKGQFVIDKLIRKQNLISYDKYYSCDNHKLTLEGKRVIFFYDDRAAFKVGLADRLRGIIVTYNIIKKLRAKGLDIDFSINFTHPFQLSNYLTSNKCNWCINQSEISYNTEQTEVVEVVTKDIRVHKITGSTAIKYIERRIQSSPHHQIHIYTNLEIRGNHQKKSYPSSFHELFKPTPALQAELDRHTAAIGGEYIDITLRFQNLLGDFYEGEQFKPLESDEQKRALIEQCMEQVEKIHLRHPDKRILVTSDSRTFLNEVDKKTYTYTIDGKLVHMATTDDNSFNLHLKAFVDFLMISRAEKIYLLRTGQMYNSGFPRTAAQINNREFEYIEF